MEVDEDYQRTQILRRNEEKKKKERKKKVEILHMSLHWFIIPL